MGGVNRILHGCVAAGLVLGASVAAAQTTGETSGNTTGQESGKAILPPISITATRNPVEAFEFPGMVSVIGRRELDSTQASTPDDVLRYVPGVDFFGGPRRTGEVPSIRGFSGDDVIVLLDGARQNYISGHDGRFFVDPFFLRQIEVVRGSSSALYGSGGTGGVIELRTVNAGDMLAPGETHGLQTMGGFQGVNQEWNTGLLGAARPTDNVEVVGGAVYRTSEDISLGNNAPASTLSSQDRILSGLFKATAAIHEDHEVELSWQRFSDDAVEPNNGQSGSAADLTDKEVLSDNYRLAYSYADPSNPWIDATVLATYTDTTVEETALDNLGAIMQGQTEDRILQTAGIRVDNRSRLALGEDGLAILTYGVEAYRDKGEGSLDGGVRGGVPTASSVFSGVFAQGQLEFENVMGTPVGVTMIPGLRFDHYTSESDDAPEDKTSSEVSPKFALQVRPAEPVMLFGSYGRAFRAPNLNELFPTGTHFVIPGFGVNSFIPNTDLRPQTTDMFEVGAGLRFRSVAVRNDQLQLKGSHYWIKGDDFIDVVVTQPGPPACFPPNCNGTTQNVNVPEARLHGYEIEGSYESHRALFEIGYAHIDGENEQTGEPLGVLTPDTLTFHAAAKLPEIDSMVGWRITYADDFTNTTDPALMRSMYVVNDIYASWAAAKDSVFRGFAVFLGIDNLFDRNYSRVANDAPEPGRNYKGTLRYTAKF